MSLDWAQANDGHNKLTNFSPLSLHSIVGKRDVELFYKDLTISDLDENLSEMSSQCDQQANTITNLNAHLFFKEIS